MTHARLDGRAVRDLLAPQRTTEVVDVGANPIDGPAPYAAMLAAGLCRVTGFEPQADALAALQARQAPNERHLPHAVADGAMHTLHVCRGSGMTSLLAPDAATLALFAGLVPLAEVLAREPVQTHRLDELAEIAAIDLLKLDVQGSELMVLQGGRTKLAQAVAVHTEVSFVTLYQGQPPFGEIDRELRLQGFMPHCFDQIKQGPIAPCVVEGDQGRGLRQLLEADIVYVRDIARPAPMSDEQLRQLALIAHCVYGSFDLVLRCIVLLEARHAMAAGSQQRYAALLNTPRSTG
ncbi:methyltransferase, FkbM family [Variovorax sp. SRS16]|uniref:FkbM family methyltransferase n=1 Tax=Variovorax sp. SRS16 TaxID=282217 RepID=UPI001315CCAD|nr:FkbM family methyltransferase [Variovorax sp. SRS16]VTU32134.1 methyltransferase, FkbM family [Variovorax sp. SRS16]